MKFRFSRYGKKNKYKAIRSTCALGHDHRSRLESEYCFDLHVLKKSGQIKSFEFEKRFHLEVNGKRICDILPDFLVIYTDGREQIHECKGVETDAWRIKWKLMQALYPKYTYVLVK